MRYDDLPESKMVADRRGKPHKPGGKTMAEMRAEAESEPQPALGPSGAEDSDLARQLGKDDVLKDESGG